MIRIRFFGPRELIQRRLSDAQYVSFFFFDNQPFVQTKTISTGVFGPYRTIRSGWCLVEYHVGVPVLGPYDFVFLPTQTLMSLLFRLVLRESLQRWSPCGYLAVFDSRPTPWLVILGVHGAMMDRGQLGSFPCPRNAHVAQKY